MKKLILLSLLVLGIAISLSAQEIPFVFDENRIDVGTMYVYEYSANKEDFEPGRKVYFYIKTLNDIEIMWIPIEDTIATHLIKYMMNWNYMMFENTKFLYLKNKLVIGTTLKASGNIDFTKKILKYSYTNRYKDGFKEENFILKFKSIPTYFYTQTDLIPLWFALRFYPLEKEKISVNHNSGGHNIKFYIKYIGKEEVEVPYGKVLCHKFELFPQISFAMKIIFRPKKAWIWLTSEDDTMYMVKYRNNNIQNPWVRLIEFRLAEVKKTAAEEWEEFKSECGVHIKGD